MGPPFVMIFWAVLLTPIAVLIGVPLSFLGPSIYYTIRGTPRGERRRGYRFRCGWTALFTVLFVPAMCTLGLILSFAGSDNYWEYQGAFDYWRMPLEPPYELVMVDTLGEAAIHQWKNDSAPAILWGITKYEKRGPLVAGFYEGEHGWFLFDCTNGAIAKFTDRESFHKACTDKGFTSLPAMMSIRDNWHCYWHGPNRRKK